MFFCFCGGESVSAYGNMCDGEEILSNKNNFKVCNENVYLNKDDISNSSFLKAEVDFKYKKGKLVYAGKIDGIDTFYSSGFNYYGVVYDAGLLDSGSTYSDLSINGEMVYNGKNTENTI